MSLKIRNFLRVNGAVLTLPFMPSIAGEPKKGAKPAKKLAMMYIPNGIVRRGFFPGEEEANLPGFIGGFNADKSKNNVRKQNNPGIHPLEFTSTMQPLSKHHKDVTLVTGMDRTFKNGQDVHAQGASCYLTSVSPEQAAEKGWRYPNGRSLDQVIGDHVGQGSVFKTLEISCNGFAKPKEDIYFNNISWYGRDKIAPSIKNPQKLYERLFMADSYQTHLTEVTDLVLEDAKSLSRKLGNDDKQTLNEFMEMIRSIEIRIARQKKMINDADIRIPKSEILPRGEYIRLQADLMLLAFQMGITNISTFMIGPERWDATLRYEGSTMLDNSLVTYGAALGDGATHQFFDLPFMIAGKGQGQIKQGRFIQCKSGTLNSNMWLSLAKLMGVEMDSFSDSNGVISDLWT